ncbi:hypothetical protein GCM10009804_03110 [Kribbella hippodromi]|uniref:Prohead serine protease domain-containing protein n=1 Tax=Kribbella hippodromi TaxID=434347 RepID=A0ABN2C214_9ACTN
MTDDVLFRAFTPDLEIRSDGDGRTIRGIAVPYSQAVRIDARLTEQFARGAFNHQLRAANRVKLARGHLPMGGSLIGRATLLRDDAAGLYAELRVSETPLGDETLALVKDGALTDLSIGFRERKNRNLPGGITERVKADLSEIGVVLEGAYGALATVSGVRAVNDDLAEVEARIAEARQILATLPPLPIS